MEGHNRRAAREHNSDTRNWRSISIAENVATESALQVDEQPYEYEEHDEFNDAFQGFSYYMDRYAGDEDYQDAYDDDHIGLEYELADYDGYEAEGEDPDTEDRERGEDRAHELRDSEEEDLAQNDEISPIHTAFRPQSDNQQRRDESNILITDRQLLEELLVLEKKINILREWFDDFHPETYSPESKIIVSVAGHYSPHDLAGACRRRPPSITHSVTQAEFAAKMEILKEDAIRLSAQKIQKLRAIFTPSQKERKISYNVYRSCRLKFDASKSFDDNTAAMLEMTWRLEARGVNPDVCRNLCRAAYKREERQLRRSATQNSRSRR